jgi:hypothetical protein
MSLKKKPRITGTTVRSPQSVAASAEKAALSEAAVGLLKVVQQAHRLKGRCSLATFVANEARFVVKAQQIFVVSSDRRQRIRLEAVTALAHVDQASPLAAWMTGILDQLERTKGLAERHEFDADAFAGDVPALAMPYALKHLLWVPFQDAHDAVHGGMVLARATPWSESDVTVATYLASAFAPSWLVHGKPRRGLWLDRLISLRTGLIAAVLIVVVGALPVPMTALAPVEVVAKDPFVVTAGISGVVQDVLVKPSTRVGKTQPLLRLDTTLLQNQ